MGPNAVQDSTPSGSEIHNHSSVQSVTNVVSIETQVFFAETLTSNLVFIDIAQVLYK